MKVKVLDTDLRVGNLRRVVSSVNILPFRYSLFCDGINITCQLLDEQNNICFEEIIFINSDKLKRWGEDDNFIVNELLIRLGLKQYTDKEQGNKDISK